MADFERFDQAIEAILSSAETADLMCVASALRDLPDEAFKVRLKEDLMSAAQPAYLPPGFPSVTPYLIVRNAAELLTFLKAAFDAEEVMRVPTDDGKIMHAQVNIGGSPLELADGNEKYPTGVSAIHLYVPDVDAMYAKAVAAGGVSLQAVTDQFYGDREAAVRDPSGNNWYIATHKQRPGEHMPAGMRSITPYFHVHEAPGFLDFLVKAFGAMVAERHESEPGRIGHAVVRIGDSTIEASEAHREWQPMPTTIHLYVSDPDAVYAQAIAAGGTSIYPPADMPYGERNGGVLDTWGNRWWIAKYLGGPPA